MKFCVNSSELIEALAVVTKALSSSNETPVLRGIYISAFNNELYLKCSDSSVQIETTIPAMVDEDGAAVMPGRLMADLVRRIKSDKISFETVDEHSVRIVGGRSRSVLQFFNPETYPKMEEVRGDISFNIKQNVFRSMIKQTVFSCGDEDAKAILRGILMEFTDEGFLNLIALDGFRLARRSEKVSVNGAKRNAVVPSKTMNDIANIISDTEDEISITLSATHITVNMGITKIKARLIKGEYINYKNILSRKSASRILVNRSEFLESLEVLWLIAKENNNNVIRLEFDEDSMLISARSETGSINESVAVNITGTPVEIAFNARYFIDIVKAVDDEMIALNLNTGVTPCIIEPVNGDEYYYLVLPIRIMRN